jgi:predicted ribonuclease YlaK
MGAFDDNLEVLNKSDSAGGEWGRAATQDLIGHVILARGERSRLADHASEVL